eukprot:SAG11_NODE_24946_length_365_cov_2.631579_1_plen_45_part_10
MRGETVERVDRCYQAEVALHICALKCKECMGEKRVRRSSRWRYKL